MIKHYCDDCGKDITFEKASSEHKLIRFFWAASGQTEIKKSYELCTHCALNFRKAVDKLMEKFEQARTKYQKQEEAGNE